MHLLYPTAAGIVVALALSGCVRTARAQQNDLSIECKGPVNVFAAAGEQTTATITPPIATAAGGTPPYTVEPNPNTTISITNTPYTVKVVTFTVTDANNDTALCAASAAIAQEPAPPTPAPTPLEPPPTPPTGPTPAPTSALSYDCKEAVMESAAAGEEKTAMITAPVATATGGTPPYTYNPANNTVLSLTGTPTTVKTVLFKVTDAKKNQATCYASVFIVLESTPPEPTPEPTPFPPSPEPTPLPPFAETPLPTPAPTVCPPGDDICADPHMQGLRGQRIDWSGVNGGWYSLVKDDDAEFQVNVRLTAPLPEDFPDRQLITGLSILSQKHSVIFEVKNPYSTVTEGCPHGISPCLADGGLRVIVDGEQDERLLASSREEHVVDGIQVSASNLPVECRQFGGDKIWARMYDEMLQGRRRLATEESFEDWVLYFDHMAARGWCERYIEQNDLFDVQSTHAIIKIVTPAVTVRLNVGVNYQGNGDLDWDGRVLPDLEFWQMDVGLHGLSLENEFMSGILGETARPVLDEDGREVMKGYDAFRGTVEDYRVFGPLGTDFALLHKEGYHD